MQANMGKMDDDERETYFIGYLTLILRYIGEGEHHAKIAQKFGIDRGQIQSLFTAVVSECARMSTFCSHIGKIIKKHFLAHFNPKIFLISNLFFR